MNRERTSQEMCTCHQRCLQRWQLNNGRNHEKTSRNPRQAGRLLFGVGHDLVLCCRLIKYFGMGGTFEELNAAALPISMPRKTENSAESNLTIAGKVRWTAVRIQPDHVRDTRRWRTFLSQHKEGDPDLSVRAVACRPLAVRN